MKVEIPSFEMLLRMSPSRSEHRQLSCTSLFLCCAITSGLSGCGEGGSGLDQSYSMQSFHDETGVPVLVHSGTLPILANEWSVSRDPAITISSNSGHLPASNILHAVRSAVRLADGGTVALHAQGKEVVFWNSNWDLLRILKSGEGPVSMGMASDIFRNPEGGAVIWDMLRNQALFVSADGEFSHAVTIHATQSGDRVPRGVLAGGRLVVSSRMPFQGGAEPAEARDRFQVSLLEADGAELVTIDVFSGPLLQFVEPDWYRRREFEYDPLVHVSDDEIFVIDSDRSEIRVFDANGHRVRTVRRENPHRTITRERREAHLQGLEEMMSELGLPEAAIEQAQLTEWPDLEGSFVRAAVAPSGRLLIAEPGPCWGSAYCWNIYGPTGEYEGAIDMPIESLPLFMEDSELGVLVLAGPYAEHEVRIFELERK